MTKKSAPLTLTSWFAGVAAFTALLMLPGVGLAQAPTTYKIAGNGAPCVKLRTAPNSDAEAPDCLPPGTEAIEIESRPFWRKVRLGDRREGWMAKKFLEPTASPAPATSPATIPADAWLEVHFVDVG